jgi:hypothetical protein
MPIANPLVNPVMNPVLQGLVQPNVVMTEVPNVMLTPVTMPNFIGLVVVLGMTEKVRIRRKIRALRVMSASAQTQKPTYIGD